jgi:hypothetical protein
MSMQGGQNWEKGGMESMKTSNISASQVTTFLKGINFPADKQKILDTAKSKGAPDMVVQWLNKLPEKQYSSTAEVEQEFGKLK